MGKWVFEKTPQADRDHDTRGGMGKREGGARMTARRH